jgi:papain like protease
MKESDWPSRKEAPQSKKAARRSEKAARQGPSLHERGPLSKDAQFYLLSKAKTDEEKIARRLLRRKLFLDAGPALPRRIPLARIRKDSLRALKRFEKELEAERKKPVVAGAQVFTWDFIELIKDHIERTQHRRPGNTGELVSLLPYFDWRLTGIVTQPRDQRPCQSCWAHTAAEAFESRLMYNVNRVRVLKSTDALTRIAVSVQGVMDCLRVFNCESGGNHIAAFDHFVRNGARLFELSEDGNQIEFSTAPTDENRGPCGEEGGNGIKALTWDFAIPRNPLLVPRSKASVRSMKKALLDYGALAVNIIIDGDVKFNHYTEAKYPPYGVYDVDPPHDFPTNHNVLLTGWDDEREAWIIVNSFGRKWGSSCVDLPKVREHFPWTMAYAKDVLRSDRGCMYVRWGVSKVGELAAWIETHLDNEEWLKKARIELAERKAGKESGAY